jgi:hypothetical protein
MNVYGKTEYVVVYTDLVPDLLGNRRKVIDVLGDRVFIDTVRTTADLKGLFYGVDDKDLIPASLSASLDVSPSFFRSVKLEWTSENDYKRVVLIIGRDASVKIQPLQVVSEINTPELIRHLKALIGYLVVSDYDYITIDLSVNRVDALIAQNVVSLCVVNASKDATYGIKLFDSNKPALDQDVLKPGLCIERLNRASVYLTNRVQPGSYLRLLVLKG